VKHDTFEYSLSEELTGEKTHSVVTHITEQSSGSPLAL